MVIHVYYRICEALLHSGKNLRSELMAGDYGFENVVNYIKKPKFLDFLRNAGLSVEEFNVDELDVAFKGGSEDFYTLTDLLTYFDKMRSTESNSIRAKHNANARDGSRLRRRDQVAAGLHFRREVMSCPMPRYAEYRAERISALAFLYDLHSLHTAQKNRTGDCAGFPGYEASPPNSAACFAAAVQSKKLAAENLPPSSSTTARPPHVDQRHHAQSHQGDGRRTVRLWQQPHQQVDGARREAAAS